MQVFFDFNKDTTYKYSEREIIRNKLSLNSNIHGLARLIGYYKKENLTPCDIYYIIKSICHNYQVHFVSCNVEDDLKEELISFGVNIAYSVCLDMKNTINMPHVHEKDTIEGYWYGMKRFLDRCLFDNPVILHKTYLQLTGQNKVAVRIAHYIISTRLHGVSGQDMTLEMSWYDLAQQINEEVKNEFDRYSENDKEFVYPESFFKHCKKTQPKRYEKYRARLKEESDRIQREIQEHREKCEEIRRIRDARMEMYDKACDRAGCALPWLW